MASNKEDNVGALWAKTAANGAEYFTGNVKIGDVEQKVVIFENGYKETEKHPDYIIYKSKPKDKGSTEAAPAPVADAPDGDEDLIF